MNKFLTTFLSAIVLSTASLQGEIENIIIRWNAQLCLDVCTPNLQTNLQQANGPINIQINPQAGTATMGWNPRVPFSFSPLNTASRMTGIRILDTRLRVKGTVIQQGDSFILVSSGDNTPFPLGGTLNVAQTGNYVIVNNIANYPLSPDMRAQLSDAVKQRQVVTVEGPLFEPTFYTNTLIIAQLIAPKKDEQKK